jgi:hypothetical protein
MSNFDPNAILRGAQLTLVGGKLPSGAAEAAQAAQAAQAAHRLTCPSSVNRAVQNPGLFTSDHYRQAALAVVAGVAIRILVAVPVCQHRVVPLPVADCSSVGCSCQSAAMGPLAFCQHGARDLG